MSISYGDVAIRLLVTVALCGALGLERETRDQAAGLRTHILVGLGAALFTMAGAYAFGAGPGMRIDPTRVAAQVVSGIGFLGAGAIVRQGFTIRGLTTAAALWISAAVGLAVGAGYLGEAAISVGLALVALAGLRSVRPFLVEHLRGDEVVLEIELGPGHDAGPVISRLAEQGIDVRTLRAQVAGEGQSVELRLRLPQDIRLQPVLRDVAEVGGVTSVSAGGTALTL